MSLSFSTRLVLHALFLFLLLTCAAAPVSAWWAKGHMSVALLAQRHMAANLAEIGNAAAKVLALSGPYPRNPDMVQCASWPDDIKDVGLNTMSTWHYINTPDYTDANFTLAVSPVQTVNVVSVIPMLQSALQSASATSETISQSLALLIHFMGDIHQPLHNVNIFSNKYPTSDLGGNKQSVTVDSAGTKMNLHAYWDSIAEGNKGSDVARPLSESDYADLNAFVDYLEATYLPTLTEANKTLQDPIDISAETYDLAIEYAYPGAEDGSTLTATYKANAKYVAERQVLLAGYRLALMLNNTLPSVSLSAIEAGVKTVEGQVPTTDNSTVYKHYQREGLTGGATAGIAVALFVIGCVVAAAVVAAFIFGCGRGKRRNYEQLDV